MAKTCPYCGAMMGDMEQFCPACGAAAPAPVAQTPAQPQYAPAQPQYAPAQPQYNPQYVPAQPQYNPQYAPQYPPQYAPQQIQQPAHPMAWFKFLVSFGLIAGAVLNIIGGLLFLTGAMYDMEYSGASKFIYALLPDLKTLDSFYGLMCIAMGVLGIVARNNLKKYKKNGLTMYYVLLGANIVLPIIYIIGISSIFGSAADYTIESYTSSMTGSMIGSIVMLICNVIYFNKRKDVFVN